jgi:putative ABC transport system permease protein
MSSLSDQILIAGHWARAVTDLAGHVRRRFLYRAATHAGNRCSQGARSANARPVETRSGQGMKLVFMGAVIGLACALAAARALNGLLFGVSNTDPLTFVIVTAFLIIVEVIACWIPARRATKVDPLIAL